MAADEFPQPISDGIAGCFDRQALKIAMNVIAEFHDGLVAAFGFAADRLQDDVIQVAFQAADGQLLIAESSYRRVAWVRLCRLSSFSVGAQFFASHFAITGTQRFF